MSEHHHMERRIAREITARKEAERLLEAKSEELYEKNQEIEASSQRLGQALELLNSVMGAVPEIVITCNQDCVIEMVNDYSARMLGYEQQELAGSYIGRVIPDFPVWEVNKAPTASFVFTDLKVRRHDGTTVDVEVRGSGISSQGRKYYTLVIQDTAARKATEKMKDDIYWQLHEARRLEAVGALSGCIAHELNTPIQFISDNIVFIDRVLQKIRDACPRFGGPDRNCGFGQTGTCHLSAVGTCPSTLQLPQLIAEVIAALRETREGVDYVRTIVGLVKEFSHPGTGEPQTANIDTIIQNVLSICRFRFRSLNVETDFVEAPPPITCHASQIQQVLVNIIVNAVEAIEELPHHAGRIHVSTHVTDHWLRIEISDTGPGIPPAVKQRVFDAFFTTKTVGRGTGQGLAIAREIIERKHRGRLRLGEKSGFATTFVIELPLQAPIANLTERMAEHVPV